MTNSGLPWWGRGYVGAVASLGFGVLAHSLYSLYSQPIGWNWFVLAGLTLLTGSATVKLPSVPATISISETFVFTSTLLYGPAAGTLTVALDALVISFSLARRGHPGYRILFNICALPASLWIGAHLFFWSAGLPPLATVPATRDSIVISDFIRSLVLFTACYFALNSWLIAVAIAIEKHLSPLKVWKENFAWLGLNYFGGASLAALLVIYSRDLNYGFLAIVVPLLAVLYFTFSSAMGRAEDTNRHLSQLNQLYMSTIETLAMAIDAKDQITHGHIRRVQQYAVALARKVGVDDAAHINAIEAASLLHDMGKLAVPEYILNKPGALTPAEFEKMKLHASVGADILGAIEFPYPVVPIVRHHHENWDGTGYPDGLKGTDIPIGARILSVVDCFDALTSDRPYRPRLPETEAIKILIQRRATMYDPVIVDTFVSIYGELYMPMEQQAGPEREGLSAITRGVTPRTKTSNSKVRLEEINASTEEMLVLYDLARSLSGRISFADAADMIAKHLRRMIPASTCVFYLYDEDDDELVANHASGEHAGHFADLRIPRGQRLTGWVAANRMSVLNSDPVLDLGEAARSMRPPLRSCLSTSLTSREDLVGVLTAYSTQPTAFTEDHQRVLEAVAGQVGQTLKDSLIFDQERQERLRDQIIGLPNLQQLERFIAAELTAPTFRTGLAILLIDVRSTHRSNPVTDTTISGIVEVVRRGLRGGDMLFRLSETTLVALMTSTDHQTALEVSNRVCDHVRAMSATQVNTFPNVMVGTASAPADGVTLPVLIDAAKRQPTVIHPAAHPPSVH
jgi:putative nucleotidyltransferase with HDIG domain